MTATTPLWDDSVLPFQLDRADVRGRLARLDGALNEILSQHDYPPTIEALVAEVALLTALIGQTINLRWKLSLQVRGNGAARLIATDFYGPAKEGDPVRIRAYAGYDAERLDPDATPFSQIGEGYFAILIDQGEGTVPYQGIVPLNGNSISDCAASYFAQSEQIPTTFALSYGRSTQPGQPEGWRAGGIMLQHMPKASPLRAEGPDQIETVQIEEDDHWERANYLLRTVEELELIGPNVTPDQLLYRLFHEEIPRRFDMQPIIFGCSCSEEKVRNSLSIYSAKDIATMTTPEGKVTADCQFCGSHYVLDPASLGFEAKSEVSGG